MVMNKTLKNQFAFCAQIGFCHFYAFCFFKDREIFHSVRINIEAKLMTLKSRIEPIYSPQELLFY